MIEKYLSTNFFISPMYFQTSLKDTTKEPRRSFFCSRLQTNNEHIKESEIFIAKNIGSIACTSITRGVFDIFFDYILDSSEKRIKKNMKHLFVLGTAHAVEYLSSFLSYNLVQKTFFRKVPNNINTNFFTSNFIDQNYNFMHKCTVFIGSGIIYTTLNIPFHIFEISPYIDFSSNKGSENYSPAEVIKTIGKTFAVNFFFTLGYGVTIALIAPNARTFLTKYYENGNKISTFKAFIFSRIVERIATIFGSITAAPIRIYYSNSTNKVNAHSIFGQVRYLTPRDFY